MKNIKSKSYIIILGVTILIIFTTILAINLVPNYESNSYYVNIKDEMSAKIDSVTIEDGKLLLKTSGDAIEYCVKSTRTEPQVDSLCWKTVDNNLASISVFKYKKYYIWIKDSVGNISNYLTVNSKY